MNNQSLEKYNVALPRYTSYPPANLFSETFNETDYLKGIENSNHWKPENISIYVHIPYCHKLCFYCGCNKIAMPRHSNVDEYIAALKKEIEVVCSRIDPSRKVSQIHFGGGTPNAIPAHFLSEIVALISSKFDFVENPEIAIECNPAYLNEAYIETLKETGFNRFSIGIQDFDTKVLKNVNRDASSMPVEDIIRLIRQDAPANAVNLDFIYGLPGQTVESFATTIEKAAALKPERMVTFSYAHVPWVNKAQKHLEKLGLPDRELKLQLFHKATEILAKHNYKSIGLDHFVLENDELYKALQKSMLHRNFQGYCTQRTTGQVYAFGVSGISQLERIYAQNTKSIGEYITHIEQGKLPIVKGYALNQQESIIREVITQVMCNKQLQWPAIADKLQLPANKIKEAVAYSDEKLDQLVEDGIIELIPEGIMITDFGIPYIRNVAVVFDPLTPFGTNQFSKAI